jgi:hypothetical protein
VARAPEGDTPEQPLDELLHRGQGCRGGRRGRRRRSGERSQVPQRSLQGLQGVALRRGGVLGGGVAVAGPTIGRELRPPRARRAGRPWDGGGGRGRRGRRGSREAPVVAQERPEGALRRGLGRARRGDAWAKVCVCDTFGPGGHAHFIDLPPCELRSGWNFGYRRRNGGMATRLEFWFWIVRCLPCSSSSPWVLRLFILWWPRRTRR